MPCPPPPTRVSTIVSSGLEEKKGVCNCRVETLWRNIWRAEQRALRHACSAPLSRPPSGRPHRELRRDVLSLSPALKTNSEKHSESSSNRSANLGYYRNCATTHRFFRREDVGRPESCPSTIGSLSETLRSDFARAFASFSSWLSESALRSVHRATLPAFLRPAQNITETVSLCVCVGTCM